jgi:hypothetical protein
VITRQGFAPVVDNAFSGLGFSAEAAKLSYPMTMFLPGADLAPIEENIDAVIEALTAWQPKKSRSTRVAPPMLEVSGRYYADAVEKLNHLFLKNLWSDGLPILPPTEERVTAMLTGTDLPRDQLLGRLLPRGGLVTIESVAVAAAMAGCRPEYLPVLIAAVDAILDPVVYHQHMQSTTGNANPAVVVNGPIARQLRINSGYGCLGPSSVYPAGASIGRALRFVLMNVGGAIPGRGTMAIHAGPARYTGLVFAEDEAGLPADWAPLNTEWGCPRGTNTVTVLATSGGTEVWEGAALEEKDALHTLYNFAGCMRVPFGGYYADAWNPRGSPGIVLMARGTAQGFARLGWSKSRIRKYLWENSMLEKSEWLVKMLDYFGARHGLYVKDHIRYPMPITPVPENIMIVVAGGEQSGHSYWLQVHGGTGGAATRPIVLPKNLDSLLAKAEEDLGPMPAG